MANEEQAAASSASQTTESESVLDQILNQIRPADVEEKNQAVALIETFVSTQLQPGMVVGKDARAPQSVPGWLSSTKRSRTSSIS